MNKKIFAILLVMLINLPVFAGSYLDKQVKATKKNVKYESVKKHTAKYDMPKINKDIELKDPHLISLSNVPVVNESQYKAKIAKDNEIYNTKIKKALNTNLNSVNVQPAAVDFYNVYRIAEKIIRANNLDYINWRIAIRKSEEEFNAATSSANFIYINTALYDSLYTNSDALAFIIGHEMAHQILGHEQRTAEMYTKLKKLRELYGSSVDGLTITVVKKKYLAELRNMEYIADALGAELMTRAGYDMDKGMEALTFMSALPNVKTLSDDHPMTDKRIESIMENRATFPNEWVNEGKYNIINSNVLDVKKSSDRVSIVISKDSTSHNYYKPENKDAMLKRIAYTSYRNRNMKNAIKYFEKFSGKDYVNYLYISYANEYLYKQTHKDKYLTEAKNAIEKAQSLASSNKYVQEQAKALNQLKYY